MEEEESWRDERHLKASGHTSRYLRGIWGGHLEASWGHLGDTWRHLGGILEPSEGIWRHLEASEGGMEVISGLEYKCAKFIVPFCSKCESDDFM